MRPRKIKKSPAPFVHATKAARKAMWEAYGWFVAAFREAAEKLKAGEGERNVEWPEPDFSIRRTRHLFSAIALGGA